jgi:hypothetical protein
MFNEDAIRSDRDSIWFKDTNVLFGKARLLEFWPHPMHTPAEKVNAMTRFAIYAGVLLYLMTRKTKYPVLAAVAIAVLTFYYHKLESEGRILKEARVAVPTTRASTLENPFGNPLVTEDESPKGEVVDTAIQEANFKAKVVMDFEDAWGTTSSSRQFMTMPDHDPSNFAQYLYGDPPCIRKCPTS